MTPFLVTQGSELMTRFLSPRRAVAGELIEEYRAAEKANYVVSISSFDARQFEIAI